MKRIFAAVIGVILAASSSARAVDLQRYEGKYYVIHTDLAVEQVKEVDLRMTRMAEEYHLRTQSFAGQIKEKFPFFVFKHRDDYIEAGGLKNTAGVFMPDGPASGKLMAVAGEQMTDYTWHTIQHEGFHQFVHAVIGGDVPPWVNEGMAEYFGEGLFTGDGFVVGIIPPWRLTRVKAELKDGKLPPVDQMMKLDQGTWNAQMKIENYDLAWSMVHFMVHAEGGKYQTPFSNYIRAMSDKASSTAAWSKTFGSTAGFSDRWKDYWTSLPDDPTADLYAQASTAILNSFLARATAAGQSFPDFDDFRKTAAGGGIKTLPDEWLPPALLEKGLGMITGEPTITIDRKTPKSLPTITRTADDGTRWVGSFNIQNRHCTQVIVTTDDTAKVLAHAKEIATKDKTAAKNLVQIALKNNPTSPSAADARAFLKTLR